MPCIVAILALFAPRVVAVVLWLFTRFFDRAFGQSFLLWVLGVIFLPITTICYAWAMNAAGGVRGVFVVVMIVAVLLDLSSWEGGRRGYRS